MDIFLIIIGVVFIVLGILIIGFYQDLVEEKKHSGLSFKLRTAGIGLIIIGAGLIIRGCKS